MVSPDFYVDLLVFLSLQFDFWVANVILTLDQSDLQTAWLQIITSHLIVFDSSLEKCLQMFKTTNMSANKVLGQSYRSSCLEGTNQSDLSKNFKYWYDGLHSSTRSFSEKKKRKEKRIWNIYRSIQTFARKSQRNQKTKKR